MMTNLSTNALYGRIHTVVTASKDDLDELDAKVEERFSEMESKLTRAIDANESLMRSYVDLKMMDLRFGLDSQKNRIHILEMLNPILIFCSVFSAASIISRIIMGTW